MRSLAILLTALLLMQSVFGAANVHLCQEPVGINLCAGAIIGQQADLPGTGDDARHTDPSPHHHDCCSAPVADSLPDPGLVRPERGRYQALQPVVYLFVVHFDIFHPPA